MEDRRFDRRRELTPEYRKHYNRGWRTSTTTTTGSPLDNADGRLHRDADGNWQRGEYDAWYDGYMDAAAGREKWHLPNCPDHTGSSATHGCREA